MSAPQDIKVGNFRGKCSALEGRIQQLHEQVKELEADNAKLHYRQEVLTQLCFSTQWLSSILAVNGPRLEGPLHAGMCSTTKSVVDQVGRDLEQLLGWSSSPPSLLPPPFHSTIALDDVVNSCVMSGSCMGVLEYALASIHAAPEQFACWVSATVQQAGAREALLREQLASLLARNATTPTAAAAGAAADAGAQAPTAAAREPAAAAAASSSSSSAQLAPTVTQPVASSSYSLAAGTTGDQVLEAILEFVCTLVMVLVFCPQSNAERYGRSPLQNPSGAFWRQQTLALEMSQQQVEAVAAAMEVHMQLQASSIQRQEQLMRQLEACLPPLPPAAAAAAAAAVAGAPPAGGVPAAATGGASSSHSCHDTCRPQYQPASAVAARQGELAARAAALLSGSDAPGATSSGEHSTGCEASARGSHEPPPPPPPPAAAAGRPLAVPTTGAPGCGVPPAALLDGTAYDVIQGLVRQLEACGRKHAWLCAVCACQLLGTLTLRQVTTFVLNTAPYPVPMPSWAAWLVGTVAREGPSGLVVVPPPPAGAAAAAAEGDACSGGGAAVSHAPSAADAATAAAAACSSQQARLAVSTFTAAGCGAGGGGVSVPHAPPPMTRRTAAAAAAAAAPAPAGVMPWAGLAAAAPPPPAAAAAAAAVGGGKGQGGLVQLVDELLSFMAPQQQHLLAVPGSEHPAAHGPATHSTPAAPAASILGHPGPAGAMWPPGASCQQLPSPGRLQLMAQAFPVTLGPAREEAAQQAQLSPKA